MVARLPEHENIMSPRMSDVAREPGGDRAGVGGDDGVVGRSLFELVRHHLRLHRLVGPRAALLHQLAPVLHPGLRLLQERAVLVAARAAAAAPGARAGVADQADLDRDSAGRCASGRGRSARRAPGRASGRTRCRGSSMPTISSVSQSSSASCDGRVPSRPMPPVVYGLSSGTARLAEQRLDDRRAEQLGDRLELVARRRARRARPGSTTFLPAFRISAARRELVLGRQTRARGHQRPRRGAGRCASSGARWTPLRILQVDRAW